MARLVPALLFVLVVVGCEQAAAPTWPSAARVEVATSGPDTPLGLQRVFLRWPHAEGENLRGYRITLDGERELGWTAEPSFAFDTQDRVAHEVRIAAVNLERMKSEPLVAPVPAATPATPPGEPGLSLLGARVLAGQVPDPAAALEKAAAEIQRCAAGRPVVAPANVGIRLKLFQGKVQTVTLDPPTAVDAKLLSCVGAQLKRVDVPSEGRAVVVYDLALRP